MNNIKLSDIRRSRLFRLLGALLLLASCSSIDLVTSPQSLAIDDLTSLMEGIYSGHTGDINDRTTAMTDTRLRLHAPGIGSHVMYWQVTTGENNKIYRQRILTYRPSDNGNTIIQTTWQLPELMNWPEIVNKGSFAGLQRAQLKSQLTDGCVNEWRKTESGWRSHLDPAKCRIWSTRRNKFRRIEGESILTKESLKQAERGFSDQGVQEFGTPPGQYHTLYRQP